MYSYGPPHMAGQKQDDQLEHTFSSYVRIWDVALKTCQRQWTIGRSSERGSGISMLAAWHDDDDDINHFLVLPNYYYYSPCELFYSSFHWSLSNSKSPQVSRTLLSIQADLNLAVIWIVSYLPLIFNSPILLPKLLRTIPSALTRVGITVIFMSLLNKVFANILHQIIKSGK